MIDVKIEDNTAQSITSAQCVNVPYLFRRTARCRRLSPRAADTGAAPCRASPRRCWAGRGAAPGRAASTPCWRGSSLTAGTPRAPGTPTPPSTGPCPGATWTPWIGGWHIHLTHEHTHVLKTKNISYFLPRAETRSVARSFNETIIRPVTRRLQSAAGSSAGNRSNRSTRTSEDGRTMAEKDGGSSFVVSPRQQLYRLHVSIHRP